MVFKMLKQNKGVTLMALAITIIVLLILASIATYSSLKSVKDSKTSDAKAQLKVMQTYVNSWYQEFKNGNQDVLGYGSSNISDYSEVFKTVGVTDSSTYKLFTAKYIKENLGIDGINRDMLIDIKNRNIILTKSVQDDKKTYYTLEDFGILNVK